MEKIITEADALKHLNISNWRELKKEHAIQLLSILPDLDTEVAKKALEQYPEFVSVLKTNSDNYREFGKAIIESERKGSDNCYEAKMCHIKALTAEIAKDSTSFEQKIEYSKQIREITDSIDKKDAADKAHNQQMLANFGKATFGLGLLAASGIGIRFLLKK